MGDVLVDDTRTRFIAFTGSKEVGLRIHERAAKHQPGQIWIKRTVLEMGGKDAILVDETADLDSAALGVVVSAFGFQGQKCSACSRAIVVDDVYDALVEKIVQHHQGHRHGRRHDGPEHLHGAGDRQGGLPQDPRVHRDRQGGGTPVAGGGPVPDRSGYFIQPTIIADVAPDAASPRRRSSGRSWPSSGPGTSTTRWRSPTAPSTG